MPPDSPHNQSTTTPSESGPVDGAPEPQTIVVDRDRREDGRPENARPRDRFGAPLSRDAQDEMPDRVEPEDVCDSVDEAIDRAIDLFDQQRFFEAHEFFEWAWKGPVTPDDDRPLFKGLAQIAVGYTHTQRGNATGATTLLERGMDHVDPYRPASYGVDLDVIVRDADQMRSWLAHNPATPDAAFPSFPPRGQMAGG